jgi:hypothetical protein
MGVVGSYRVISDDQLETNIKNEINDDKPIEHPCPESIPYMNVSYGPINVQVCSRKRPTLKTGRRSKFLVLEGNAAIKREKRRERNRKNARKFKEKRIHIENQLINEINQLENHHTYLLSKIEDLQSYRHFLEEQTISTKSFL